MKNILILLFCTVFFNVDAAVLNKNDLFVRWAPQNEHFKTISSYMEYKADGEVIFSHGASGENIYRSKMVKEVDDLYIFHFYNPDSTLHFKFVASGWKTEQRYIKMLFGILYEYNVIEGKEQIVNGFPLNYLFKEN